jgi:hypothetical protein
MDVDDGSMAASDQADVETVDGQFDRETWYVWLHSEMGDGWLEMRDGRLDYYDGLNTC